MTSISTGSIQINELEKTRSVDQNDQTTMVGRAIVEGQRSMNADHRLLGVSGAATSPTSSVSQDRTFGLALAGVDQTANTVTIGPGNLMADRGALDPDPGPPVLEGTYRIGINEDSVTTDPITPPGGILPIWHVVEAQVFQPPPVEAEVDILVDPPTGTFERQTRPKFRFNRIQFRTRAGSFLGLPTQDVRWTPLYAFQVNPDGTPQPAINFIDLRQPAGIARQPQITAGGYNDISSCTILSRKMSTVATRIPITDSSLEINFDFAAEVNGVRCAARGEAVDATVFLEEGETEFPVIGNGNWFYLYLAPSPYFAGPSIANLYGSADVVSNCLVIITSKAPDDRCRNSLPLNPRTPLQNLTVPAGGAAFVGAVQGRGLTSPFNSFDQANVSATGEALIALALPQQITTLPDVEEDGTQVPFGQFLPVGITSTTYQFVISVLGGPTPAEVGRLVFQPSTDEFPPGARFDYGSLVSNIRGVPATLTIPADPSPTFVVRGFNANGTDTANLNDLTTQGFVVTVRVLGYQM